MNLELRDLFRQFSIDHPSQRVLRYRFALQCAESVRHLLESDAVIGCLDELVANAATNFESQDALDDLAARTSQLANSHVGSKSIDGCGHAAVSATYAIANATAGKAEAAADYAAYATVYNDGGSALVSQPESFARAHAWQVETFESLAYVYSRRDTVEAD